MSLVWRKLCARERQKERAGDSGARPSCPGWGKGRIQGTVPFFVTSPNKKADRSREDNVARTDTSLPQARPADDL